MKTIILRYSFLLLLGFLLVWWIRWYSPLQLPERIPWTPIKIGGLLLIGLLLTVLIIAEKHILRTDTDTGMLKLTLMGTTIVFLAEIVFQSIRLPFLNADTFNDYLYYFLLGTIGGTIFGAVLSFLIAFQLIRKNSAQLFLLIIILIVIVNIVKYAFPIPGE